MSRDPVGARDQFLMHWAAKSIRTSESDLRRPRQEAQAPMECSNCDGDEICKSKLRGEELRGGWLKPGSRSAPNRMVRVSIKFLLMKFPSVIYKHDGHLNTVFVF